MWIKINQRIVDSTLIRHISGIQEASPERFHADKMDEWKRYEMLELGSPEAVEWRYMLNLVGLHLGAETRTEPRNSLIYARWRVIKRTAVPDGAVEEEFVDDWKPFYFFVVRVREAYSSNPIVKIKSRAYATRDEASAARDALATMLNELEAALPSIEI